MLRRIILPITTIVAILLTSCAGAEPAVQRTMTLPPTGTPVPTPPRSFQASAAPRMEATRTPRPSATPVPPSPTPLSGEEMEVTPSPSPDMAATIVAVREPEVIQTHASPDGRRRVDVISYPCDAESGYTEEEKLEQLMLVDQQTKTETVVQSQLQTCGGLGAAGLGGLFWSPDSQMFYYTDAREGVPDGGGGVCWDRPLWRLHVDEGKSERHGDIWARSRSGRRLAIANAGEDMVVETLGGERISGVSVPPGLEVCEIIWSPDGETFVYLRTQDPFRPNTWELICVEAETGASNVTYELEDAAWVSMTWDSQAEVVLSGVRDAKRETWTVEHPCAGTQ